MLVLTYLTLAFLYERGRTKVGDVFFCDAEVFNSVDQREFSLQGWQSSPTKRLGMLKGIAPSYRFVGKDPEAIEEFLGPSDCYVSYDDEPCYRLEANENTLYLAMSVAHSGDEAGKVFSVSVTEIPHEFLSCLGF